MLDATGPPTRDPRAKAVDGGTEAAAAVSMPPDFTSLRAGATSPLKFGLGGDEGLNVLASGSPTSQQISCTTGVPVGAAAATAGTLTHDKTSKLYTYS